jgi:hypothetical protein
MLQQVSQVALSYLTHRLAVIGFLLWSGLVIAPQFWAFSNSAPGSADAAQPIAMVLGMPLVFMMPFLVGHVKMQFAHPRCRLMPRFLPAHLLTLCSLLVVITVVYPFLLSRLAGFEPLCLVALSLTLAMPAIWGAHFGRPLGFVISIAVFYSLLTEWGLHWWILDAPEHRVLHALVVAASGGLLIGWLWRLAHLHEEMDDYLVMLNSRFGQRSRGEHSEQRRLIAKMLHRSKLTAAISDAWLSHVGGYHAGNPWRLARLMDYGFSTAPPVLSALLMAAMMLAISVFMIEFSFVGQDSGPGALWFLIQFGILLPGMFAGEWMFQRKPRMSSELLRPVSRTQYFNALLTASAWNAATLWITMHAALALAMLRVNREQLTLSAVATFLVLSFAIGMAAFGLGQRTAVWDSSTKRLGVTMLAWLGLAAPIIAWWTLRSDVGDAPFVFVAAILLALGAGLILEARRAWNNIELS